MESKIGKNFSAVIKNGEISSSYRGLFQSQNYLIVLLDKKGNFIYVNKLFCQIFGKSLSELRGKSCCSIFSPDDLNKNYKEVKKSLESEPFRVNVEQRVKTINGWKWLDWEIYGVYENEKFIGIRAIGNNKTDLKMTENMTDVIFQIDLNYEFQYVTPSVKRLLGFKPEYFYGKHIKDVVHPDDLSKVIGEIDKTLAAKIKERKRADCRIKNIDGDYVWIEGVGNFIYTNNNPEGIIINVRKIEERKTLEKELKEKTEERDMILNNIDVHIFYLKDPATYAYVNKAVAEFLGYEQDELRDYSVYNIFEKEKADYFVQLNEKVFRNKEKIINKYRARDYKGKEHIFESIINPKLDKDGEVEYIICAGHDITEKAKANEQLEKNNIQLTKLTEELKNTNKELVQSQQLFRINFEESNIGMLILDEEGKIIEVNDTLCKMIGYKKYELIKVSFNEIIHPEQLEKNREIYNKMKRGLVSIYNFEDRLIHKNGDTVWVNHNMSIVRDDTARPVYILNQIENITEKKKAEQKIIEQKRQIEYSKIKTEFFAKLSHELKTPLNLIFSAHHIISANSEKYFKKNAENKIEKYLDIIKQNGMRLLRLVNNVIDLTKIDTGNFNLRFSRHNIAEMIRQIVDSTEEYVIQNNRKIFIENNLEEKYIDCDPFSIERIILNLISNAVKFTNSDDSIKINLYDHQENVLITIEDTGIGIKKDKLQLIFEQFRQVDESFTRRTEGSGIGLSLVKSLVELHNGDIWVESEYGSGTKFFIRLPAHNENAVENSKEQYESNYLMDKVDVEFSDIYNI